MYSIRQYSCSEDFLRGEDKWNDLWSRAEALPPSLRAEHLGLFCREFLRGARMRALAVENEDGQLVAAIPLIERGLPGVARWASLAYTPWFDVGDLLWDPQAGTAALTALQEELVRRRWAFLWLETIRTQTSRWQAFLKGAREHSWFEDMSPRPSVGLVELTGNWDAYYGERSRSHRRHIARAINRVTNAEDLRLEVHDDISPESLDRRLLECFIVEDRSWKGAQGSSILRSKGMWDVFCKQAEMLNRQGCLQLVFLKYEGVPIAFEFAHVSRDTYYAVKVGYDERFAKLAPGQVLRYFLYRELFQRRSPQKIDYVGPLVDATAKWSTLVEPVHRVVLARPGLPRRLISLYRHLKNMRAARHNTQLGTSESEVDSQAPQREEQLAQG